MHEWSGSAETGDDVEQGNIIKGYEVAKGQFIELRTRGSSTSATTPSERWRHPTFRYRLSVPTLRTRQKTERCINVLAPGAGLVVAAIAAKARIADMDRCSGRTEINNRDASSRKFRPKLTSVNLR